MSNTKPKMTDPDANLWSLFPPGFTYRPPVEDVCSMGHKHRGSTGCSVCQTAAQLDAVRIL